MTLSSQCQFQRENAAFRLRRGVLSCRSGQAMTEFAFIAPILLAMLCGIFEFSGILFAQTLLDGGAREASRYGITGAVNKGESREAAIRRIIGENTFGIIDIDELDVKTQVYETFGDIGQPEPFVDANGNGVFDSGEQFNDINGNGVRDADRGIPGLGGPGDIVVYQLSYGWEIMIPMFEPFFGEEVALTASVAVRNEPFGS